MVEGKQLQLSGLILERAGIFEFPYVPYILEDVVHARLKICRLLRQHGVYLGLT